MDLFEKDWSRAEKAKPIAALIFGIALLMFLAWIFFSSDVCEGSCWRGFDIGGKGGNP